MPAIIETISKLFIKLAISDVSLTPTIALCIAWGIIRSATYIIGTANNIAAAHRLALCQSKHVCGNINDSDCTNNSASNTKPMPQHTNDNMGANRENTEKQNLHSPLIELEATDICGCQESKNSAMPRESAPAATLSVAHTIICAPHVIHFAPQTTLQAAYHGDTPPNHRHQHRDYEHAGINTLDEYTEYPPLNETADGLKKHSESENQNSHPVSYLTKHAPLPTTRAKNIATAECTAEYPNSAIASQCATTVLHNISSMNTQSSASRYRSHNASYIAKPGNYNCPEAM